MGIIRAEQRSGGEREVATTTGRTTLSMPTRRLSIMLGKSPVPIARIIKRRVALAVRWPRGRVLRALQKIIAALANSEARPFHVDIVGLQAASLPRQTAWPF